SSIEHCVRRLVSYREIPKIFLGGGGYNHPNVARLWASITAICAGRERLDVNIPDHDYWLQYGPTYELNIVPSMLPNRNTAESLQKNLDIIYRNIDQIKSDS